MRLLPILPLLLAATAALAEAPNPPAPKLNPGEALVVCDDGGKVSAFGDDKTEHPMGSLAQLVWLKMAGADWSGLEVYYVCSDPACQAPKGHGRVDMKKALHEDCDAAFLYWANWVREDWVRIEGEGLTRMKTIDSFGPFLGERFKGDGPMPQYGPEWIGRGELLRASPSSFMAWWKDDQNSDVRTRVRELLGGFFHGVLDRKTWWFKAAASSAGTWALGSDGHITALLYLPVPETATTATDRLKTLMGLPVKKK
ncbi:MAG TPA: hypothetical protein VJ483_03940 [Holophagaceae bacterium]|nr:hypothetical protein [Holophagaceae bacterium]